MYIRYRHNGRKVKVVKGLQLSISGDLKLCRNGLHASLEKEDARGYCGGVPIKVACWGEVILSNDKFVSEYRKVLEIHKE